MPPQTNSFAQTMAVLAPDLGEALLPLARQQALIDRCRRLPPILTGLLKCRLAADETALDVQQQLWEASPDIPLLQRYLADAQTCALHPQTASLLIKLLSAWQKANSPLRDAMSEVWLQYDLDRGLAQSASPASQTINPSVFIGLLQSLLALDERWFALEVALNVLLEGRWRPWRETLRRCLVACPPEAFVSHIGIMLGRNVPAVRVHVKRLRPSTLARYLRIIGWQEDVAEVQAHAERLFAYSDQMTVCLQVGAEVFPSLAFECVLVSQSATEPRWAALLDYLVEGTLCTTAKRDAILGWPGMTTPLLSDLDWPDRLVAESLTRPANHLSVFHRRLSHIEVVYRPGQPMIATGYLRFVPQWLRLEGN